MFDWDLLTVVSGWVLLMLWPKDIEYDYEGLPYLTVPSKPTKEAMMDAWNSERAKQGLLPIDKLSPEQVRKELEEMQPWKCGKCSNGIGNLTFTNREAVFNEDGVTQVSVKQTIGHRCAACGNKEDKVTNHCMHCNAEDGSRHDDGCKWLRGQLLTAAKKINEATNGTVPLEALDAVLPAIVEELTAEQKKSLEKETQLAMLGFYTPDTRIVMTPSGFSLVRHNQPVNKYVQVVEPKQDDGCSPTFIPRE